MFKKIKSFLFENISARQTIAKNTFWLFVSNFGGRLFKSVIIIYAARVLGAAGYGIFSYALTLAAFLTLFMDPGINNVILRDAAESTEEERRALLSTAAAVKLVLVAFGVFVIIIVGPYFSTLPGARPLLPIVAFIIAFDTVREFLFSFIRSVEKMEREAAIFLLTNLAIVIFGFAFITFRPTAKSLGWGYALGTGVGALAAILAVRNYFKAIFAHVSAKLIIPLARSAWPFAITGALGILLTNADILILSWMRSASEVGVYSAAIRIVQVLYLFPTIFQLSALPLFARLAGRDNHKFRAALERVIGFIFLVSIPLALGSAVLGTRIMTLVFGAQYASGGLAFKILMLTMIVDYPAMIISAVIFTYHHQKSLITTAIIAGVSNVALDLLLIPPFGMAGSAVATLIAQGLSNAYLWHIMKKINYFTAVGRLGKIVLAGLIMFIASAALLRADIPVALNVAISAVIYFGALTALREPLLKEISAILSIGRTDAENVPAA